MLDLKDIARNFDDVLQRLQTRGGQLDLGPFRTLVAQRRELILSTESLAQEKNQVNDEIKAKAQQDPGAIEAIRGRMRELSARQKELETQLQGVEEQLSAILYQIPNVPHPSVPVGASAEDNVVVKTFGEKPLLPFSPRQHFELGERLGLLDFERAAKVSGARFAFTLGALAKMERALVSFMIDTHTTKGYVEVLPPYLVNRRAMTGTGQLPKFEEDAFKTAGENELFLIPTAEVPVTNFHQDEILELSQLPLRYVAFSPCFRAEAGSAGKDTRGLIRMHQFHKVELVKFAPPETSMAELESLTQDACEILEKLELHHRVVALCTGDMGFSSMKTYDIEVWLPGQNTYREISSCSNFGDFQARRAKIRFRAQKGDKPQLLHTLNGSGLAVGRTLVAILENCQREDGSVAIPRALWPYMGGQTELRPR